MTNFKYGDVIDGELFVKPKLYKEVENVWTSHQTFINKVLLGLGMIGWEVRFFSCRNKVRGGGVIAKKINLIVIEQHTKVEMVTTFLHELLHFKEPKCSEQEVELRSVEWANKLLESEN